MTERDGERERVVDPPVGRVSAESSARRLLGCELELLRSETLAECLRAATQGLRRALQLHAVSLVLEDPQHEVEHLLLSGGSRAAEFADVTFVHALMSLAPELATLRAPVVGAFARADHGLLLPRSEGVGAIALLPLRRGSRTAGVLCVGGADAATLESILPVELLGHLAGVVALCLENACNRVRLERSGLADYLTGWHNRRYLTSRLREELARARRTGSSVACLMINIDGMRAINDAHGHAGGDEVLREVTVRIEAAIRASDIAVRFGGDEFTLLLPDTSREGAALVAERVRAALAPEFEVDGIARCGVTLSVGGAALVVDRVDADLKAIAERLITAADTALDRARVAGGDRVVIAP